jgi:hypothetical protein
MFLEFWQGFFGRGRRQPGMAPVAETESLAPKTAASQFLSENVLAQPKANDYVETYRNTIPAQKTVPFAGFRP